MLAKKALHSILAVLLLSLTSYAMAGQLRTDDGYVIYYNALNTTMLPKKCGTRLRHRAEQKPCYVECLGSQREQRQPHANGTGTGKGYSSSHQPHWTVEKPQYATHRRRKGGR